MLLQKGRLRKVDPTSEKGGGVWTKANPSPGYAKGKKKEGGKGQNNSPKKWKSEISAMTTHNNEMLDAMVETQKAQMEAMSAQALARLSVPGSTSSVQGLAEESIRVHDRSRISLLRLQLIQKGAAAKPAGTLPVFPPS